MLRVHWRKNYGFRLYKVNHLAPFNSIETLNYQQLSNLHDKKILPFSKDIITKHIIKLDKGKIGDLNLEYHKYCAYRNEDLESPVMQNQNGSLTSSMTQLGHINSIQSNLKVLPLWQDTLQRDQISIN